MINTFVNGKLKLSNQYKKKKEESDGFGEFDYSAISCENLHNLNKYNCYYFTGDIGTLQEMDMSNSM